MALKNFTKVQEGTMSCTKEFLLNGKTIYNRCVLEII